jgi:transcriptional regulator with XRE-family HTH domain
MVKERANLHGGSIIRAARKYRGLTQECVAELYGVTSRTIKNWENKHSEPTFGTVQAICEDVCKIELIDAIVMTFDEQEKQVAA